MLMLDDYNICTDNDLLRIIKLLRLFLQIIQIMIPIALILMGSLDFGKAVMSTSEDNIKKGQKAFVRRCMAAVLVFLVVLLVNFITGFVGSSDWKACWTNEPTTVPKDTTPPPGGGAF